MNLKIQLMTTKDVAKFLKVTETTMRRWANSGELKCYRIGRRRERRFDKKDILNYINRK